MPITLVRIDDRLVHGQVVESWVPYLRAKGIVIVSDAVAVDGIQQALMRLAMPDGVSLRILGVAEAARCVGKLEASPERLLILTPSPREVLALWDGGLRLKAVNVGGLHGNVGRVQLGRMVFLGAEDVSALRALADRGVALEGQAVPLDKKTNMLEQLQLCGD